MKYKLSFKQYLKLIFINNYTILDGKNYRLSYMSIFFKAIINVIFLYGGFILLTSYIYEFMSLMHIKYLDKYIFLLAIIIILFVNILIIRFATFVEIET